MFDNKISITYDDPMSWTRKDGSKYYTNWDVYSNKPSIRYAVYETLEETLQEAYTVWLEAKGVL